MANGYKETIPLNGMSFTQVQSKAAKVFNDMGWKFLNYDKFSISAYVPKGFTNPDEYDVTIIGTDTDYVLEATMKNPRFGGDKLAKRIIDKFKERFECVPADDSAKDVEAHEKYLMQLMMSGNKKEAEKHRNLKREKRR